MAKTDAIHNTVRTVPENFLRLLLLPLPPSSNLRRSHGAHCRFTGNSQFYRKSVFNQKKELQPLPLITSGRGKKIDKQTRAAVINRVDIN